MSIQWLQLPPEIRTMIYHELFCSMSITLHQNLETSQFSPEDSLVFEKELEINLTKDCTIIKDAGPLDGSAIIKAEISTQG